LVKANKISDEKLIEFIESPDGAAFMEEHDAHWGEMMNIGREHGFIVQAYGGTAIVCTLKAMMDEQGSEGVAKLLNMSGIEIPVE